MRNHKNKQVELVKKIVYDNLRFYSQSNKRGVTYDGFELISKRLRGRRAEKLVDEIKHELRTVPKTYYFWIGVFSYNAKHDIVCRNLTFSEDNLTVPLIDTWLSGKIQELVDENPTPVQGWAFIATPNSQYDLDRDSEFAEYFINSGVVDANAANAIFEIIKLEKLTKVAA